MDRSLDDIIKAKKGSRGGQRRGEGRRRNFGGGGVRGARGSWRSGVTSSGNLKRQSAGDIEGKWQHDMFQQQPRTEGFRGLASRRGGARLEISNLDFGVSTEDIKELFGEFGQLARGEVNYDRSGRSLGTASVVYARPQDAQKAATQYNNVPLDGRPMMIQLVSGTSQVSHGGSVSIKDRIDLSQKKPERSGQRRGGSATGRGGSATGRGRGGRGRGSRGGKTPLPTADQLDAELDAYKAETEKAS